MSKTSTTLTLTISSLALVLLGTVPGSTLAHSSFSNSGNIIKSEQNCADTDSCTLSSSNVINQGPTSTTPSPSPTFGTILDLGVELAQKELMGVLLFEDTTRPVDVNVPLTITFTGTGVPPNLVTTIPAGEPAFISVPFEPPTNPGTYTVQAHFAGAQIPAGTLSPSDSQIVMFTVP
jgi:hypothetical protein